MLKFSDKSRAWHNSVYYDADSEEWGCGCAHVFLYIHRVLNFDWTDAEGCLKPTTISIILFWIDEIFWISQVKNLTGWNSQYYSEFNKINHPYQNIASAPLYQWNLPLEAPDHHLLSSLQWTLLQILKKKKLPITVSIYPNPPLKFLPQLNSYIVCDK